ncbi:hypothetical protein Bca52824_053617 [Brassica carinata]|uniref:Uncharacterized protein n=1 Tax=Brassica carinata TaxID=52824 RepID=A0A8X7R6B2_BRACI|nr:hypothetical protein Bca52824_053617 [Brassica carinata]
MLRLYEKYHEPFEEYIKSTVMHVLKETHDEYMMQEPAKRWSNHKVDKEHEGSYYSRKLSSWIHEDSCPDYILKNVLRRRGRMAPYLHSSSEPKLIDVSKDTLCTTL